MSLVKIYSDRINGYEKAVRKLKCVAVDLKTTFLETADGGGGCVAKLGQQVMRPGAANSLQFL